MMVSKKVQYQIANWQLYEKLKAEIKATSQTSDEYEQRIKELAKQFGW